MSSCCVCTVGPNAASSHLSGSSSQLHWEWDWTPSVESLGVALMLFECKPAFLACTAAPRWRLLCQSGSMAVVTGALWAGCGHGCGPGSPLWEQANGNSEGKGRSWLSGQFSKAKLAKCKEEVSCTWGRAEFSLCLAFLKKGAAEGKTGLFYLQPLGSTIPEPVPLPLGDWAAALLLPWVSTSVTVQWLSRCQCHKGNFI